MTRVHHARPQHAPTRSITLDQPRAAVKKKKPYKIVLEAVTQEKKKLHSILTYASNAPPGFGFIPAGNPEFTEWCKEQCRQRNLDVHIVSAKPKNKMHADPEKLSHHVHRVGHHFPIEIVNLACSKFGYTYDDVNGLKKDKTRDRTNWIAQRVEDYSSRRLLHGRPTSVKEDKEHTRGAVREMFPKIPEADLTSIVNHAFEEGTNRVGNAKELPLARRVQLAVVAHIRHMYTDYDKILKTGSWMEARQKVEHVSLAKLKEWRDEAGEQSNELEDTFREVIVLDDDDESSDEGSFSTPDEREQSMEIVSSRATARDLQPERYADYPSMNVPAMRRAPRRTILVQPYPAPRAAPLPNSLQGRTLRQSHVDHDRSLMPMSSVRSNVLDDAFRLAHTRPMEPYVAGRLDLVPQVTYVSSQTRSVLSQPGSRDARPLMREIDGQMYHLEPIRDDETPLQPLYDSPLRAAPRLAQHGYAPPPPPPPQPPQQQPRALNRPPAPSRRPSEQDVVLPSVERETVDLTSPRHIVSGRQPPLSERPMSRGYAQLHSPKRGALHSFQHERDLQPDQNAKRLRPYRAGEMPSQTEHRYDPAMTQARHLQSIDGCNQQRPPPPREMIDLTSSPRRAPTNGEVPHRTYPAAGSHGDIYVPRSSHGSPMRELRAPLHEAPYHEPIRSYMSTPSTHERRDPLASPYVPARDGRHDRDGSRYLRSGLNYGGYDLH